MREKKDKNIIKEKSSQNGFFLLFLLTNCFIRFIIINVLCKNAQINGEIAQLARATGSYPVGREFESHPRYQVTASLLRLVFFLRQGGHLC